MDPFCVNDHAESENALNWNICVRRNKPDFKWREKGAKLEACKEI